jgi:4-hydroxymandelate oxidase
MPEVAPTPKFPALDELEAAAPPHLSERLRAYLNGGAAEERTLAANRAAFERWSIRPRVWAGVDSVDLSTAILGAKVRCPIFVAPMAYHAEVHPDGELGVARACRDRGWAATYSTLSSASLEQIAETAGPAVRWFQLYLQPDFEVSRRLVERAERAGYSAIVLTADTPVLGVRDRQARAGFAIDSTVPIGNGPGVVTPPRALIHAEDRYWFPPGTETSWDVVDRIRAVTRLPVIVKGILTGEDAREAARHGAKAVIVSNHGGRQLDRAPATLDVLPEIVEAAGSDLEVYLDGGVRRGGDVLVALALGARAVGVGRPILWALALGGGAGVAQYLQRLEEELAVDLALSGRATLGALDRSLLRPNAP